MRFVLGLLFATALAVATAFAQTSLPQPNSTRTTLAGTAGQVIIAANPTRRSIRICNTDATTALWIYPGTSTTAVSHFVLAPVTSNVITCYTPPSSGVVNNAGAAWMGTARGTTSNGTVSVEEWN